MWQYRRRAFVSQTTACVLAVAAPGLFAQSRHRIRLVALEPGAQADMLGRVLQGPLAEVLDVPVVVDNYGGAGGRLAAQAVLRGEPDGNTLLIGGANNMVMAPLLSRGSGYEPLRDFVAIAPLATVPFALAAGSHLGVSDLAGLVGAARSAKQPLSAGSAGIGGSAHMAIETLFQQLSLPFLHVPFRGTASASQEVLAGRIDLVVTDLPKLLPFARDGRLHILGVTGSQRSALAPEIPTLAEQGVAGFRVEPWYALFCRAEVARPRAQAIAAAVRRVSAEPGYLTQLQRIGFTPWIDTVEGVYARMKQDHQRIVDLLASGALQRE